jgi:hypothetical protein
MTQDQACIGGMPNGNVWIHLKDATGGGTIGNWEYFCYDNAGGNLDEWCCQIVATHTVTAAQATNGLSIRVHNSTSSAGAIALHQPWTIRAQKII